MCSRQDSPVNPLVTPDKGRQKMIRVGSGRKSHAPFAHFDRATSSWRTYQACFIEGWERFKGSFPSSGIMRNGLLYRRRKSALPIFAIVSGLSADHSGTARTLVIERPVERWPTPTATDAQDRGERSDVKENLGNVPRCAHSLSLAAAVKRWPTPLAADAKRNGSQVSDEQLMKRASRMGPGSMNLTEAVQMHERNLVPTPTAGDWRNTGRLGTVAGMADQGYQLTLARWAAQQEIQNGVSPETLGALNPEFAEWLMGYPIGWTE